ncbi:hypothetical protein HMF7854_08905 [Sphingomonas ginkgonis]|uniref:Uncharacterized protein n=1 Tax=Sphingomonas ginkgonis TaxID=2315330 RepID=A0A3R9WSU1_9SPHN|nr:hypothetical protein [Sphingomonas ginkgonis]RST30939.1 hypothetical protein HMF7854_08905 [Sphingomonas ginkgonis]
MSQDQKQPMQADGSQSDIQSDEDMGGLASRREGGGGESEGGAYPNPHSGDEGDKDGSDKFFGHGGQSDQAYYGKDQLGEDKLGKTDNSQTSTD